MCGLSDSTEKGCTEGLYGGTLLGRIVNCSQETAVKMQSEFKGIHEKRFKKLLRKRYSSLRIMRKQQEKIPILFLLLPR